MATPTHHPRRGRMAAAAVTAAVLVVAGLVLLVTAGSSHTGGSTQAIAGAPSSTSTAPESPDPQFSGPSVSWCGGGWPGLESRQ